MTNIIRQEGEEGACTLLMCVLILEPPLSRCMPSGKLIHLLCLSFHVIILGTECMTENDTDMNSSRTVS